MASFAVPSADILTPLPALGVDFEIIENKGPKIERPIRAQSDVDRLGALHDVDLQLPFIAQILKASTSPLLCFTGCLYLNNYCHRHCVER